MDFWKIRAKKYNKLDWVNNLSLLKKLINFCDLKKDDIILDAGCGTGVLTNLIVDKVKQVHAIDISWDMIKKGKFDDRIYKGIWNLEKAPYVCNHFDKVIARMVFHHIDNLPKTFNNCYCMLKNGGAFIIEEGIPPSDDKKVRKWYADMMSLKEKRNNFSVEELENYFIKAGFGLIMSKYIIDTSFLVNNWLESSGLDKKIQKKIYDIHYNAPKYIKDIYHMKIKGKEIIIQTKILFIKGIK